MSYEQNLDFSSAGKPCGIVMPLEATSARQHKGLILKSAVSR